MPHHKISTEMMGYVGMVGVAPGSFILCAVVAGGWYAPPRHDDREPVPPSCGPARHYGLDWKLESKDAGGHPLNAPR